MYVCVCVCESSLHACTVYIYVIIRIECASVKVAASSQGSPGGVEPGDEAIKTVGCLIHQNVSVHMVLYMYTRNLCHVFEAELVVLCQSISLSLIVNGQYLATYVPKLITT